MCTQRYAFMQLYMYVHTHIYTHALIPISFPYGVATKSRLLTIMGLFAEYRSLS